MALRRLLWFRLSLGLAPVGQILIGGVMLNASAPPLIQKPVLTVFAHTFIAFSPTIAGAAAGSILCGSWLRRLWASDLQGVPVAAFLTTVVGGLSGGALFGIALLARVVLHQAFGTAEPSAYAYPVSLDDLKVPLATTVYGPVVAATWIFSSVPGALWWIGSIMVTARTAPRSDAEQAAIDDRRR